MGENRRFPSYVLILIFSILSFLAIFAYRFFFPGALEPLPVFNLTWKLSKTLLDFIDVFPAIALSAILGHFGFGSWAPEGPERFSVKFFDSMKEPLIATIVVALLYAALFLLALPVTLDFRQDMVVKGILFRSSSEKATLAMDRGEWLEAERYMNMCQRVWPESPNTQKERDRLQVGLSSLRAAGKKLLDTSRQLAGSDHFMDAYLPDIPRDINSSDALVLAKEALSAGRFYDAHWLAALAEKIAGPEAGEAATASLIASEAWNSIALMEPGKDDEQAFSIFRRKREGYSSVKAGDWIRAYYIFDKLAKDVSGDADVDRFLTMSRNGARKTAFFVDEVAEILGQVELDTFLSFPNLDGGRDVLLLKRLHISADLAYVEGFEMLSFGADGKERYGVQAPYAKFGPFNIQDERSSVSILLVGLDRNDEKIRWEPVWNFGKSPDGIPGRVLLAVSWEELILATQARNGIELLSVPALNEGARLLGPAGFITEAFRAETIRRIAEPFAFLALAIIFLTLGWRMRSPRGAGWPGYVILALLPFAVNLVVQAYRFLTSTTALAFTLMLPFGWAVAAILGFHILVLFIALVFLAGQRG